MQEREQARSCRGARRESRICAKTAEVKLRTGAEAVPPASVMRAGRDAVYVFPLKKRYTTVVYIRGEREAVVSVTQRKGMQDVAKQERRVEAGEEAILVEEPGRGEPADRILVRAPEETTVSVIAARRDGRA